MALSIAKGLRSGHEFPHQALELGHWEMAEEVSSVGEYCVEKYIGRELIRGKIYGSTGRSRDCVQDCVFEN